MSFPFYLDASAGRNNGHSVILKDAVNADIDIAAEEDVWSAGGTITYLSAADTLDVVSGDAADDDGSTGATEVTIYGLDANYNEISEPVTMDGTSEVTTTSEFLRVNYAVVTSSGSGNTNAGVIDIHDTTNGNTQASIPAGASISKETHYTVPAGENLLLSGANFNVTGSAVVNFKIMKYDNSASSWILVGQYDMDAAVTNNLVLDSNELMHIFNEKDDLKITAATDTDNTTVRVSLRGVTMK